MILRPYKKIKELEEKIRELEVDYFDYSDLKKEKEERLRKEREGLHNPTALCAGCKHFVAVSFGYPYGCKLNNKCEDRVESDEF